MFNLLVSFDDEAWDGRHYEFATSRVITGYTEVTLRQRLTELNAAQITEVMSYPCVFTYETERAPTKPARIGWITEIRKRQNAVQIAFEFDPTFPPIPRDALERLSWDLDIQQVELYNTHWAVKNVDLLTVLVEAQLVNRTAVMALPANRHTITHSPVIEIQTRPTIFRVPTTPIENDLVSLMMPFDHSFRSVSDALQAECADLGLRCLRADDIWGETELIQDIFSLIYKSKVVVCDFTGRNPNVFYEAGIAHTLGRQVIPITQIEADIPADLRHHRYLHYLPNTEGLTTLRSAIGPRISRLASM